MVCVFIHMQFSVCSQIVEECVQPNPSLNRSQMYSFVTAQGSLKSEG